MSTISSKTRQELLELAHTYLMLSKLLEMPEEQQDAIVNYFSVLIVLETNHLSANAGI